MKARKIVGYILLALATVYLIAVFAFSANDAAVIVFYVLFMILTPAAIGILLLVSAYKSPKTKATASVKPQAYVYACVASSGQSAQSSLDAQITTCKSAASSYGYEVADVFQDFVKNFSEQRPALHRLLFKSGDTKPAAIIVPMGECISSDVAERKKIESRISAMGVKLIYLVKPAEPHSEKSHRGFKISLDDYISAYLFTVTEKPHHKGAGYGSAGQNIVLDPSSNGNVRAIYKDDIVLETEAETISDMLLKWRRDEKPVDSYVLSVTDNEIVIRIVFYEKSDNYKQFKVNLTCLKTPDEIDQKPTDYLWKSKPGDAVILTESGSEEKDTVLNGDFDCIGKLPGAFIHNHESALCSKRLVTGYIDELDADEDSPLCSVVLYLWEH